MTARHALRLHLRRGRQPPHARPAAPTPTLYSPTSNRIASITPRRPGAQLHVRRQRLDHRDGPNTYVYDMRGRMVQATSSSAPRLPGERARPAHPEDQQPGRHGLPLRHPRAAHRRDQAGGGALKRELSTWATFRWGWCNDAPSRTPALRRLGSARTRSRDHPRQHYAGFSTDRHLAEPHAVAGFLGSNYQTHEANGAPPGAIVVDNTDAGFSVTGTWPATTSVSGYLGSNYQVHAANGEPPGAIVVDNAAGSATGTWPGSTAVAGYHGSNYQTHAAGTGANAFTWTLSVPSAGTYQVYARWTAHPNRATNAKYTVNHAGGPTRSSR